MKKRNMWMTVAVLVVGTLMPYLARLPRGSQWLGQYTAGGVKEFAFIAAFNAIALAAIVVVGLQYRRVASWFIPLLVGFGVLAWGHYSLDLRADALNGLAFVFIPIYAAIAVVAAGVVGFFLDRRWSGVRTG